VAYYAPEQLRRVPAQQRARDRIQRVLDAADQLLATGERNALETKRVAEAAGISVGSLYRWFPDKEAIAEAIALRYWQELADLVAGLADAAERETIDDLVGHTLDALAAGFRARPGFLALWFGGHRTERLRDATRPIREQVAQSVERMLAATYPDSTPELRVTVARMVVLLGDGLLREAFRLDPAGDPTVLREGRHALLAYVDTRLNSKER
jgi:AcrR family transcriptional regulator